MVGLGLCKGLDLGGPDSGAASGNEDNLAGSRETWLRRVREGCRIVEIVDSRTGEDVHFFCFDLFEEFVKRESLA